MENSQIIGRIDLSQFSRPVADLVVAPKIATPPKKTTTSTMGFVRGALRNVGIGRERPKSR